MLYELIAVVSTRSTLCFKKTYATLENCKVPIEIVKTLYDNTKKLTVKFCAALEGHR